MSRTRSPRRAAPVAIRSTVIVLIGVVAAVAGVLVHESVTPSAHPSSDIPERAADPTSVEHGGLPEPVSAFDEGYPAITGLAPDLLDAVRAATTDAAVDGVDIVVNSGWRSAEHQEQLMRDAVQRYGSAEEAARWVATATTSAHVSGEAVDVGPFEATLWLSEFGARYDLCQIYANEPWHYELRPGASSAGCPPMLDDASHAHAPH